MKQRIMNSWRTLGGGKFKHLRNKHQKAIQLLPSLFIQQLNSPGTRFTMPSAVRA